LLIIQFLLLSIFAEIPYWKAKPEVYQKIQEGEIIVSAKLDDSRKEKHLKVSSAGHLKTPMLFAWQEMRKFENYPKMSEHFRNVKHQKEKQHFYIEVGAFSYYAKLWVDYKGKKISKNKRRLEWQVVKGGFQGLHGYLEIEKKKYALSEISLYADMQAEVIPIPNALLKIGLEVVGKLIAMKMRQHLEKTYLNTDFFIEAS
tara:strand:+ start:943 stop:1545 length:603 start_codon:yes stop_codon:yes gene_type:complete